MYSDWAFLNKVMVTRAELKIANLPSTNEDFVKFLQGEMWEQIEQERKFVERKENAFY